jgi:hypothetical protein
MELWELADLSTPWSLHVAATLRVADHIEAGKHDIGAIAEAAGADADFLLRILRQLVNLGVFEEPAPGQFALNDMARGLLGDGRIGFDLNGFGGRMAYAWGSLLKAVKTGKPCYRDMFGLPFWEDLEAHPHIAAQFDILMGPGHGTPGSEVIFDPADWASIRTVVDVGGGTGMLLKAVLEAHPHLQGTLVDLPRTVARAIVDAELVGQSFFDPLPAGRDLYLLKGVLADWPDTEALTLLRRIAEAMPPTGRLMILNGVSEGDKASPELLMMVLVGGRNRSVTEFGPFAAQAGLRIHRSGYLPWGKFAVECRTR